MTIGTGRSVHPTRRSRPSAEERRRELAEVAAAHFHRLGFHRVVLADIATAVGVTAPAIYRHFRNKNALLAGAVATGLDHVETALSGAGSLDEALDRLAEAALRRRDVWILLQRELRHLADQDRVAATRRFRDLVRRFTGHVAAARPDLDDGQVQMVATAAFAVLASPSTRPVALPHDVYRSVLTRAARAACRAALPPPGSGVLHTRAPENDPGGPRAEQILDLALALFHRHGYAAVRMEDIGAAAGIADSSIYHHFATKSQLLLAAYDHVIATLPRPRLDVADPVLDLVERYAAVAVHDRELFGVHVTEDIHLPADSAPAILAAIRADENRWVAALEGARPELAAEHARLLVHAARSAIHDLARIGRLHLRPTVVEEIVAIDSAILSCEIP